MFEPPLGQTDDGFDVRQCRSCQARIVWASTTNGKVMPVDAKPCADGNVELRPTGIGRGVVATVFSGPVLFASGPLRKSHFVECPDAGEWRSK